MLCDIPQWKRGKPLPTGTVAILPVESRKVIGIPQFVLLPQGPVPCGRFVVQDKHIDVLTEQVGSNRTVEGRAAFEELERRQPACGDEDEGQRCCLEANGAVQGIRYKAYRGPMAAGPGELVVQAFRTRSAPASGLCTSR